MYEKVFVFLAVVLATTLISTVDGITCHVCEAQYEQSEWSTRFFDGCGNQKDWKQEECPEAYDSCYIHITNYTENIAGQSEYKPSKINDSRILNSNIIF